MELGWLDVCLRVSDIYASRRFYEGLGFVRVEGDDAEGWAVVVKDEARVGLYAAPHMGADVVSLNFRGGDVAAIVEALRGDGYAFAKVSADGRSAELRDPDGHLLYFDCAPGETKKVEPLAG